MSTQSPNFVTPLRETKKVASRMLFAVRAALGLYTDITSDHTPVVSNVESSVAHSPSPPKMDSPWFRSSFMVIPEAGPVRSPQEAGSADSTLKSTLERKQKEADEVGVSFCD